MNPSRQNLESLCAAPASRMRSVIDTIVNPSEVISVSSKEGLWSLCSFRYLAIPHGKTVRFRWSPLTISGISYGGQNTGKNRSTARCHVEIANNLISISTAYAMRGFFRDPAPAIHGPLILQSGAPTPATLPLRLRRPALLIETTGDPQWVDSRARGVATNILGSC